MDFLLRETVPEPGAMVVVCENCMGLVSVDTLHDNRSFWSQGSAWEYRCPVCGVLYERNDTFPSAGAYLDSLGLVLDLEARTPWKASRLQSLSSHLDSQQMLPVPALMLCLDLAEHVVHVVASVLDQELAGQIAVCAQRVRVKVLLVPGCDAVTSALSKYEAPNTRLEQRAFAQESGPPPEAGLVVIDGVAALRGPAIMTREAWTHCLGGEEVRLVTNRRDVSRLTNREFAVHWERLGHRCRVIHLGYPF